MIWNKISSLLSDKWCHIVIIIILILVIYYVGKYVIANLIRETEIKINNTKIIIKFDDFLKQKGKKLIGFNEFFDTNVNEKCVSKKSLSACYINKYEEEKNNLVRRKKIDDEINKYNFPDNSIIETVPKRKDGGKTTKYKLGTICEVEEEFILLAFTHFNLDTSTAYLSFRDYISCLMDMWRGIGAIYSLENINIPLLGGGITRFGKDGELIISDQKLLEYLLLTFKLSKVYLKNISLTIVLRETYIDKINLYELKNLED